MYSFWTVILYFTVRSRICQGVNTKKVKINQNLTDQRKRV
jgi:hypothetical protein